MNDTQFERERDELIAKLEHQQVQLSKILELDKSLHLISVAERDRLAKISKKNANFLHKLITNEFEIAIVGLEKAGKSTFANALIESNILPSAPERCTFTATRLKGGDSNRAVVEFYTEQEFQANFAKLLEELDYPNAQEISFKSLDLQEFERYFDAIEEKNKELYKIHIGKTNEEIKDIIKDRDRLVLTGEKMYFKDDELTGDDFQSYIKGEGDSTARPRSVKSIEIESSKLEKLDSAIIYDVPGFDSPTVLHKQQTEERLKHADAILLVTNVGRNPSIPGTSLGIITKSQDDDGIQLADKLFVFGNLLDTANSLDQAQKNIQILTKDVEKYKIGEQKRVFAGSALKYLSGKGLAKDVYTQNFDIDSGIDDIREALIDYYQDERFTILKRKIDSNHKHLLAVFEDLLNDPKNDIDENFSSSGQESVILLTAQNRIKKAIKTELQHLKFELKREIIEGQYFSSQFEESLGKENYFSLIAEEDWDEAKIANDDSLTRDLAVERINQAIRIKLHAESLQNFSHLIKSLTDEKTKDIEIRILDRFSRALLGESGIATSEIEVGVKKLVKKITSDISHNESRFEYLIERFSRNIFDAFLSYPLLSQDRLNKFNETRQEFIYLNSFFDDTDSDLVGLIIAQKRSGLFDKIKGVGRLVEDVARSSYSQGIVHGNSQAIIKANAAIKQLEAISKDFDFAKGLSLSPNALVNIDGLLQDVKRSTNKTDAINEINKDIENLRMVLKKAVIPAINLETAFLNGVDKQIKRLIAAAEDEGNDTHLLTEFLANVIPLIEKQALGNIQSRIDHHEKKKELVQMLKNFT